MARMPFEGLANAVPHRLPPQLGRLLEPAWARRLGGIAPRGHPQQRAGSGKKPYLRGGRSDVNVEKTDPRYPSLQAALATFGCAGFVNQIVLRKYAGLALTNCAPTTPP